MTALPPDVEARLLELTIDARKQLDGLNYYEGTERRDNIISEALAQAYRAGQADMEGERISAFARAILHGDDEHRAWLLDAAEQFCRDGTVSPPRALKPTPAEG